MAYPFQASALGVRGRQDALPYLAELNVSEPDWRNPPA